jgi:(4S)-4-hydroxy-5-phosphonooxypentane-2,3-dione isomerase
MVSSCFSQPRLPWRRAVVDDDAIFVVEEMLMSRIMIVVEFEMKPQHVDDFIKLMKNHAELSRAEDGCQQFDVLQAQDDPNKIFFVESWRDQAALDVHSKVPRMEENRAIYTPWLNSRKGTRCNVP